MGFTPFDIRQKRVNERYYSMKGKWIYSDFSTFASDTRMALANALEFRASAGGRRGMLGVAEFGVGGGEFAGNFLRQLKALDEKEGTDLLERTKYVLVDVSARMLEHAKRALKDYNVTCIRSDALEFNTGEKFHYIRANELLSDLPSKLLFRRGMEVLEVGFSGKGLSCRRYRGAATVPKTFPEGYLFPLNLGAISFLKSARGMLANGGYADFFDYGFGSPDDALGEQRTLWNESISRVYGGQVTVDINFQHIRKELPGAVVERQKEYLEDVLGEKLFQVNTGGRMLYLDESELGACSGKLEREGYSEEFISGNFDEESDYWHLRISR